MSRALQTILALCLAGAGSAVFASPAPDRATVTGEVGGGVREVRVNGAPPRLADDWSDTVDPNDLVIEVAGDGTFEVALSIEGPAFYRLTAANTTVELYLEPGDASRVAVDPGSGGEAETKVELGGDRAALNRFNRQLTAKLAASERDLGQRAVEIFSSSPAAFAARIEELRGELLADHRSFLAERPELPKLFVERTRDDVESWLKQLEVVYPSIHHELTGREAGVSEGYLEEVAQGWLDRPASMSSSFYVEFLDEFVNLASAGDLKYRTRDLPREKLVSRYRAIAALETSAEIRDYLLAEMFRNFRISYGPRDWGRALAELEADDPDSAVARAVRPLYEADMAERESPDEIRVFKTVDGFELEAHVFYPEGVEAGDARAAYLFFHGGGWAIGTPEWGYAACERMAARGMVAITFEYRLADVHGSDLFASVEDVQSAVRWVRAQAHGDVDRLPVDPNRVVAAGFSAGGHLAAGAAILEIIGPAEPSPRPDALVVHSASYDLTKGRFFDVMTGGRASSVSLTHQVGPGLVPTLLFHGTYDHLAPITEFQGFVARMQELENDFEYHLFEVGHFFRDEDARRKVSELTDAFLVRRGFLEP